MFEKRVIIGKKYCVTAPSACLITANVNSVVVTLVDESTAGQYYFYAPTTSINSSVDPSYILEVAKSGGVGNSSNQKATGANGGYYIPSMSEDGVLNWEPSKPGMQKVPPSEFFTDTALKSADNTFTGMNTFAAMTQFPAGASFEQGIPWLAATAMAMGVPPLAAYAETWAEYRKLSNIGNVASGEHFSVFAPYLSGETNFLYNNFNSLMYCVAPIIYNPCYLVKIIGVTWSTNCSVMGPYRCVDVQVLHIGESVNTLINWGHNLFSKAPDLNVYAPNLTRVTSGVLIKQLNSVDTARIKLPRFNNNFTLKIGAIQKDDVLYLLENLPALPSGVSRTAAISCDPALETDEDFLAQVAAFYDAETKTGWNVALTFQGNEIDAAATTYSMRRITPPIFAMREECEGGAYASADGKRWAIFSGSWVAAADCGYTEFPNLEAALAEWGLTEYVPEIPENT